MSFDVYLAGVRGGEAHEGRRGSARAFLARYDHTPPDEFGFTRVTTGSGAEIELNAAPLFDETQAFESVAFHLRRMDETICELIFGFAEAAQFVIFNGQAREGTPMALVPPSCSVQDLPGDMIADQAASIGSGAELFALLDGGFDAWRAYRDKVIGGDGGGDAGQTPG